MRARGLFIATTLTLGCGGAPKPASSPAPSPEAGPAWPLCGVLTTMGYGGEHGGEDAMNFLVPRDLRAREVRRYHVVDATTHAAPLIVYAGWWGCVTAGRIEDAPADAVGTPYGTIWIEAFEIDQATAERGQE